MAFDEGLAGRFRDQFRDRHDVVEKKMFGGLCFMVRGHMCCGIVDETLMARIGPEKYAECLRDENAREMDFTGKPLKGMIYVDPDGVDFDEDLAKWLRMCTDFVESLPPRN